MLIKKINYEFINKEKNPKTWGYDSSQKEKHNVRNQLLAVGSRQSLGFFIATVLVPFNACNDFSLFIIYVGYTIIPN
jgi:hypothetical protein